MTVRAVSFRCAVTRIDGEHVVRRKCWIEGHDVSSLAASASALLGSDALQCSYLLTAVGPPGSTFLEVTSSSSEALVGPMAGPTPPEPSEHAHALPQFLEHLGLVHDPAIRLDLGGPGRLLVVIRYASFWYRRDGPRHPAPGETRTTYERRRRQEDETRLDHARHEGFHVLRYARSPARWGVDDLEHVLRLAYEVLPAARSGWREVGCLTRAERKANGDVSSLVVERGDYTATIRLPMFPARAILKWLEARACQIELRHPVTVPRSPRSHVPGPGR
jgi:hypothetical protein